MARYYKTPSKRIILRSSNGKFRQTTGEDLGVSICKNCNQVMSLEYMGDSKANFMNPTLFGYTCSACGTKHSRNGEIDTK